MSFKVERVILSVDPKDNLRRRCCIQVKRIFGVLVECINSPRKRICVQSSVLENLKKENWTLIYLHAIMSGYTCMQVQLTSQMICRLLFFGFCERNYSTTSLYEYFQNQFCSINFKIHTVLPLISPPLK